MLGKNYKRHKQNVLNIFEAYKVHRGSTNDGVDIEFLQNRIDSLAKNKFTLAVAGEVKAGKSTFLNALLREELLPADVLQATSAVIEIFKSDNKHLKVTYADGTVEEFANDCKEKLKEICSINDEYRHIPFTQINTYIQNHENLSFADLDLEELEKIPGILGLNEKKPLIEKYIKETPKNKIPISISLGYPLEWNFEELRLVDSPGINATGGVENLSYEYFTKANAIIFVRRISAIESISFRDFVTKVIPDKNRKNIFLVLTNSGQSASKEVERLTIEAKRLYGEFIDEERIIAVDSILSLIHSELENGIPLQTIRKNEEKKRAVASYKEDAEEEGIELVDVLKNASGFQKMYAILEEYSSQAPTLQLKEILNSIDLGYRELEIIQAERIELLKNKKKAPQFFSEEIEKQTNKLEEYRSLLHQGENELTGKYIGVTSKYYVSLNDSASKYNAEIKKSNSLSFIRKTTSDALNSFEYILNTFSNDITSDLMSKMKAIALDFESKYNIHVPKIDLKAIEERSKQKAYRMEDIMEKRDVDVLDFFTFGIARIFRENEVKVGEEKVFDNDKHLQKIKHDISTKFQEIKDELRIKFKEIFGKYLGDYKTKFNDEINAQQKSLTELRDSKQSNEQIISDIDTIKKKISSMKPGLKSVEEILNDIS